MLEEGVEHTASLEGNKSKDYREKPVFTFLNEADFLDCLDVWLRHAKYCNKHNDMCNNILFFKEMGIN